MRHASPLALTTASISSQHGWSELSPSGRLQITARNPAAAIAETSSERICGATESSSVIFRMSMSLLPGDTYASFSDRGGILARIARLINEGLRRQFPTL